MGAAVLFIGSGPVIRWCPAFAVTLWAVTEHWQRRKYVVTSQLMIVTFTFLSSWAVSRKPRKRFGPVKPFLIHLCLNKDYTCPRITGPKRFRGSRETATS